MRASNCRFPELKKWYENHNVSVAKLAELSGVHETTIRNIIYRGKSTMVDTAQLLADAIDLPMDTLFRMPPQVIGAKDKGEC